MTPKSTTKSNKAPNHVAIIMDGNGRWAQSRQLPRIKGHEEGVQNARRIIAAAQEFKIEYLTLYTFSSENWQRPKTEITALLNLLKVFLKKYSHELIENEIRIRIIGNYQEMPKPIASALSSLVQNTAHFKNHNLILAINYSSRTEILHAIQQLLLDQQKNPTPQQLNWEIFQNYLYTKDIPDPDLIIRTSGEHRLSNFLLLQGAYSEIYFSPVYWPDFTPTHLHEALEHYKTRERRFGKTSDQLT